MSDGVERGREKRGLVGGDPSVKAKHDKGAALAHPLFLDVIQSEEAREALGRFMAEKPVYLEIGFGRGRFLTEFAKEHPEFHVVGVEVRKGLCFSALQRLEKAGVTNARVLFGDVRAMFGTLFPKECLAGVFVLFPDPWWKKKHHKKRLFDETFFGALAPHLRDGATLLVRSDVPMVLDLAREALGSQSRLRALVGAPYPTPKTDRECVCNALGTPTDEQWYQYASGVEKGE